jgi:excisionase family DNA binding protein
MTTVCVTAGHIEVDGAPYVSTAEAAAERGVTASYIGRLAKSGRVPALRMGRNWFVDRGAVQVRCR